MSNEKNVRPVEQDPKPASKPYQAPRLKVHGPVVQLTQADPGSTT